MADTLPQFLASKIKIRYIYLHIKFSTYFWFTNFASLGLQTLQIHGFESVPKIFELYGFYAYFHRSNTNFWVAWIFILIFTDFVPILPRFKLPHAMRFNNTCFFEEPKNLLYLQIVARWQLVILTLAWVWLSFLVWSRPAVTFGLETSQPIHHSCCGY